MIFSDSDNRYFTHDELSFKSWGVIVSKPGNGIDCRMMQAVTGLVIDESKPYRTHIYIAFSDDGDNWYKLTNSGTQNICSGDIGYDTLRLYGNSTDDLFGADYSSWPGKIIRVAIALDSVDPDNYIPAIKLSAVGKQTGKTTSFTEYSPVFTLGDNAVVTGIPYDTITSGGASVTVTAKLFFDDGTESNWITPEQAKGKSAKSVQLKADYLSSATRESSAKISQLYVSYFKSGTGAPMTSGRIYSVTQDWYMKVKSARITIKHSHNEESTLSVYSTFRKSPGHVVKENLGIAPSGRKTFELAHKGGISYDSFRLYADNALLSSGYELNSESGRVTLTAPEGSIITCSYDYGWDKETWTPMTLTRHDIYDDYDLSEFSVDVEDANNSISAFMIETNCISGHEGNDFLGIMSGTVQTFEFKHRPTNIPHIEYGTMQGGEYGISSKNFAIINDSRIVRVAAPIGKVIRANYDWQSEPIQIFQVSAVYYD